MHPIYPEDLKWLTVFPDEATGFSRLEKGKLLLIHLKAYGLRVALGYTNNQWVAVSDYCPHKGASMAMGWINSYHEVVCPLHNYCYNVFTGQETTGEGGPDLVRYFTRIHESKVQIGIPGNTPLVQSS